jgi:hypothetical protein
MTSNLSTPAMPRGLPPDDLAALLRSRVPIIIIESRDEPQVIKSLLRACNLAGVYALLDFHPYLQDAATVRLLKDIAQDYERCARTIVLISYELPTPPEIEHLTARCVLALPDRNERRMLIEEVAREWMHANPRQPIRIDNHALQLLVENMSGLSASDTARLARKAIFDHGAIQVSDVPVLLRAKYDLLNRQGILRQPNC